MLISINKVGILCHTVAMLLDIFQVLYVYKIYILLQQLEATII
jgi:hypothetical protein